MARRVESGAAQRPVVAESWRRCTAAGAHPETGWLPPLRLAPDALRDHRNAHPLGRLLPMFDELLGCGAGDGHVFAVTDERGTLLWVRGDPRTVHRVERMNFVAGAAWAECEAGTNAPGTALVLGEP